MHLNRLSNPALILLAALSGCFGWSGQPLLLPIALLFPVLWSLAPGRIIAALVSGAYFLAAARGLPQGVATYFHADFWPGILLWILASSGFVFVHALLWTDNPDSRPLRFLAALVLMAVPPFGILGWASPLTAAGILFPGWGWWGLALMTAGLMGLASRFRPIAVVTFLLLWFWSAANWNAPVPLDGWTGINLKLGASLGREAGLQRQQDLIEIAKTHGRDESAVVVLPESAIGTWTPTIRRLWLQALANTDLTVVAGAIVATGAGYDNVLVEISGSDARILYRERMPVPGSMWQPWHSWFGSPAGARASFFSNPIVEVDGQRVAPLICYEQLLVWPILQSMLEHPDAILAVGNGWWAGGTSIAEIQRAATIAWARLFNVPVTFSFNS